MRHLGQYSPIPEIQPSRSPIRSAQPDLCCVISSPPVPVAETRDILALLQSTHIKMASPIRSSPELRTVPVSHRPVQFTNTAIPRFNGDACWYQHQHVFDAIAKSKGWDDETAALQLFDHLEGGVLKVPLLIPEARRSTRSRLSGAVSDHYSAPVRLAIYRRKFENAVRRDEGDPSMFAMELETLAVRGFGDAGLSARTWMVHDRFIIGHLRHHLDSVPPDTPLWTGAGCWRATLIHTLSTEGY